MSRLWIAEGPYVFGRRSREALATVHPDLVRVLERARGWADFTVLEGHRDERRQTIAYQSGASHLQWPRSKHNTLPSVAVDVAPFPIVWKDVGRFVLLAGVVFAAAAEEGVRIRWGGDWDMDGAQLDESFRDLGHFELVE